MELFKKHSIDARYHLCLIIVVELIVGFTGTTVGFDGVSGFAGSAEELSDSAGFAGSTEPVAEPEGST